MNILNEKLIEIKNNLGKPENAYESRLADFIENLISQNRDINDFQTEETWNEWVDHEMGIAFANDILEETGLESLQLIFSDSYYAAMQDIRNAMLHIVHENDFIFSNFTMTWE